MNRGRLRELQAFDTSWTMNDTHKNQDSQDEDMENILEKDLLQGPLIWAGFIFIPIILVLLVTLFTSRDEQESNVSAVVEEVIEQPDTQGELGHRRYEDTGKSSEHTRKGRR